MIGSRERLRRPKEALSFTKSTNIRKNTRRRRAAQREIAWHLDFTDGLSRSLPDLVWDRGSDLRNLLHPRVAPAATVWRETLAKSRIKAASDLKLGQLRRQDGPHTYLQINPMHFPRTNGSPEITSGDAL